MRIRAIGKALVLAMAVSGIAVLSVAQTVPTPKWEAVSIKRCVNGVRQLPNLSPGRATWTCLDLQSLVRIAYFQYANGQSHSILTLGTPLTGGPSWFKSDEYTINAKAEGTPDKAVLSGPMLQALLEDRFKLKLHWETREVPVYMLTVAKGGPKLQPFKEGSCIIPDLTQFPQPPLAPGERRCNSFRSVTGQNATVDAEGMSLDELSSVFLKGAVGRPVINKTGITGLFDFHMEYANVNTTLPPVAPLNNPAIASSVAPADNPAGPSIFTVMEQLGLKLEAGKGPDSSLVIDSIERPTEN